MTDHRTATCWHAVSSEVCQVFRIDWFSQKHPCEAPLSGLMHLHDELIMRFYWYYYNVQSYMVAFLVNIATKLLNYAPNTGLAL